MTSTLATLVDEARYMLRQHDEHIYPHDFEQLRDALAAYDAEQLEDRPFSETLKEVVEKRLKYVLEHKEELIGAWVAQTGIPPNEACLLQQELGDGTIKFWVETETDRCVSHRHELAVLQNRQQTLNQLAEGVLAAQGELPTREAWRTVLGPHASQIFRAIGRLNAEKAYEAAAQARERQEAEDDMCG